MHTVINMVFGALKHNKDIFNLQSGCDTMGMLKILKVENRQRLEEKWKSTRRAGNFMAVH